MRLLKNTVVFMFVQKVAFMSAATNNNFAGISRCAYTQRVAFYL